jgi:hypothetical protein
MKDRRRELDDAGLGDPVVGVDLHYIAEDALDGLVATRLEFHPRDLLHLNRNKLVSDWVILVDGS